MAVDQENRQIPQQEQSSTEQDQARREKLTTAEEFARYQEQRTSGSKVQAESGIEATTPSGPSAEELLAKKRLDQSQQEQGGLHPDEAKKIEDNPRAWLAEIIGGKRKLTPDQQTIGMIMAQEKIEATKPKDLDIAA